MNPQKIFEIGTKILTNKEIKEFGRKCLAAGRNIQKARDYEKYKKIISPMVKECMKSDKQEVRRIGGKLLQSFKGFKG